MNVKSAAKAIWWAFIETPAALVADLLTMGGILTRRDESYTKEAVRWTSKHTMAAIIKNRGKRA